jgi:DNA-binding XRE family transcriptional regulator
LVQPRIERGQACGADRRAFAPATGTPRREGKVEEPAGDRAGRWHGPMMKPRASRGLRAWLSRAYPSRISGSAPMPATIDPMTDDRAGRLIAAVRKHLGMRQIDLARAANVDQKVVSLLERGELARVSCRSLPSRMRGAQDRARPRASLARRTRRSADRPRPRANRRGCGRGARSPGLGVRSGVHLQRIRRPWFGRCARLASRSARGAPDRSQDMAYRFAGDAVLVVEEGPVGSRLGRRRARVGPPCARPCRRGSRYSSQSLDGRQSSRDLRCDIPGWDRRRSRLASGADLESGWTVVPCAQAGVAYESPLPDLRSGLSRSTIGRRSVLRGEPRLSARNSGRGGDL